VEEPQAGEGGKTEDYQKLEELASSNWQKKKRIVGRKKV